MQGFSIGSVQSAVLTASAGADSFLEQHRSVQDQQQQLQRHPAHASVALDCMGQLTAGAPEGTAIAGLAAAAAVSAAVQTAEPIDEQAGGGYDDQVEDAPASPLHMVSNEGRHEHTGLVLYMVLQLMIFGSTR